ncbi:hypothetical protein PVAG01_05293 [Phlyctema vagabunda]|uniref:Copper acquisition factor BIM1-like domain-containing protein n=1 Tax=Phlyctema vagabunda TaxID=108571 RepID=A0ABR4PKU0_9HELO
MLSSAVTTLALSLLALAPVAAQHGASEAGKMGPVAFLWPADRVWDADADNTAPCGSVSGPANRSEFPLSNGAVSLTIANESYTVDIAVAIGNNPTSQSDFDDVVRGVPEVEPGHQCYKLPTLPIDIVAGTNATIQLEYVSLEGNANDTFYACADITFVESRTFTTVTPCFNVTSDEFEDVSSSTAASSSGSAPTAASTASAGQSSATATDGAASAATSASIASFVGVDGFFVSFAALVAAMLYI